MIDKDTDAYRLEQHRNLHSAVHPDVRAAVQRKAEARQDALLGASLEIGMATTYLDRIIMGKTMDVTYETMQKSGFNRKTGWRRKYTLADAKQNASTAAIHARTAWELLEPLDPQRELDARRTALGNSQQQLQAAIRHLSTVLNGCRTAQEQQVADTAARDWLLSIGFDGA